MANRLSQASPSIGSETKNDTTTPFLPKQYLRQIQELDQQKPLWVPSPMRPMLKQALLQGYITAKEKNEMKEHREFSATLSPETARFCGTQTILSTCGPLGVQMQNQISHHYAQHKLAAHNYDTNIQD